MKNNFLYVAGYSLAAGVITLLGSYLVIKNESAVKRYTHYLLGFASGVMIATVFGHLLPESSEMTGGNRGIFLWALGGFGIFYLVENFIMFHPCHEDDDACELHKMGLVSFMGLFIHSLLDGVAIAVGFEVSGGIGILTALSVILHEFPEGISISGILLHAGENIRKIFWLSFLVALATPLGAIIFALWLPQFLDENTLAGLLALTAGTFLYVACADLLPEAHRKRTNRNVVAAFIAGVVLVFIGGHFIEH